MNVYFRKILVLIWSVFLLTGCSLRTNLTMWAIEPILQGSFQALMAEPDLELARTAMAADLKIIDGLLVVQPDNRNLLLFAAQGSAGYAMLFLEEEDKPRARFFYDRAMMSGLRYLAQRNPQFSDPELSFSEFLNLIGSLRGADLPAVYWTAVAWFGKINLDRSNLDSVAEIPRARLLMQWVFDHDPHFNYSGPLLFFGTYYATFPPIMGGHTGKSEEYFSKAFQAQEGQFLYGKFLYARTYCVQTLDRELFKKTLEEIISAESPVGCEYALLNSVAKKRAQILLDQIDELF